MGRRGSSQSEKDKDLIAYCERKKLHSGECSAENINISTSVNQTNAALYGAIMGNIVENGQSGVEKSFAVNFCCESSPVIISEKKSFSPYQNFVVFYFELPVF